LQGIVSAAISDEAAGAEQRSRSTFLKYRALYAAARSPSENGRVIRRRLAPSPAWFHPAAQHGIAQAKFLGRRSDRIDTRSHKIDRLPLVVLGGHQIGKFDLN
jgi:hypothetical protein